MSRSPELYPWRTELAQHFPHLSQPMVMGLALWSLGMVLVRSCSLTAIADWWSCQLGQPFQTVRERLRDTYREAGAKAGEHRAELDLSPCWAPWLAWVLAGWSSTTLALALDATTLGQRFVLLVISVVYRGCAVPILWKHPITHNLSVTGIHSTADLQRDGKRSDFLHAFPKGFRARMTVVFAAEKATKASDQTDHLTQRGWCFRRLGAMGHDPGGLPFLGIEHHVTRQIGAVPPPGDQVQDAPSDDQINHQGPLQPLQGTQLQRLDLAARFPNAEKNSSCKFSCDRL